MKAVLISTAMTIVLFVIVTLAFRLRPTPHRVRLMILIYLCCLALSVLLWLATPANLGFLGQDLLIKPDWLDLAYTLFFFSAAFFGGVLQLYNLADRGFSLRILIDVADAGRDPIGADRLATSYGGGQGLSWMYRKRMEGLLDGAMVRRDAQTIELTPRGRRAADFFLAVSRFLRLEAAR